MTKPYKKTLPKGTGKKKKIRKRYVQWDARCAKNEKLPSSYIGKVGGEEFPRFRITVIRTNSKRATGYFVKDRLSRDKDERKYFTSLSATKNFVHDRMEQEESFVHPNTVLLMQVSKMTGGDIDAFETFVRHLDHAFQERDDAIEKLEERIDSIESSLRSLSLTSHTPYY